MPNCRKLFLVQAILLASIKVSNAQSCYQNIKLPRIIYQSADDKDVWLHSAAGSETLNAIFVGGYTETTSINNNMAGKYAVIARMDLAQNTWAWRKQFGCTGCKLETITGLAVNSAGSMVAAHATELNAFLYDEISYIFIVRSEDGHFVTNAHKIQHGPTTKGEFPVYSDGMYFDPYGMVYMAHSFEGSSNLDSDDGSITSYASKFVVSAYNINTKAMAFYWHQSLFFGQAGAITYADFGSTGSNVYVGGATDKCYTTAGNSKCWTLGIIRLKPSGKTESQTQIKMAASYDTSETDYAMIDHMHFQNDHQIPGEWLFGTTRNKKWSSSAKLVYIFRLDLDSNHNPRLTKLELRMLSTMDFKGSNKIAGIKNKMNGDIISMVYWDYTQRLYYLQFSFTQTTVTSILIYNNIQDRPFTVFMGSESQITRGNTVYQSYTVGTSLKFQATSGDKTLMKNAGAIFPSIFDSKNCMNVQTTTQIIKVNDMTAATFEFFSSEFQQSKISGYPIESDVTIYSQSHVADQYFEETWCSTFPTPPTLSGGSVSSNLCFWWDDKLREFSFSPITTTCTDTVEIIDYAVTLPAALDPQHVKVSLDSYSNIIRLTGLSSGPRNSAIALQTITVTGTLPDRVTKKSFTFQIIPSECAINILTASVSVNSVYYVTNSYASYTYPDFAASLSGCTATYTNSILPLNNWITGVSNGNGYGKVVGWSTNNEVNIGSYTITVTARDSSLCSNSTATGSYTLTVITQCWVTGLTIDSANSVFKSPALIQNVWQSSSDLSWSDFLVTREYPDVDCGALSFSVQNQDGTALDSTVFTVILSSSSGATQTLHTQTKNSGKAKTYTLRVKAWYHNYASNVGQKDFTIIVANGCETPTLTASSLSNQIYIINSGTKITSSFESFLVDPTYCPVSYAISSISPSLPVADTNSITIDSSSRTLTFLSTNISLKALYTVQISCFTPLGANTGVKLTFTVDFQEDSCALASTYLPPSVKNITYFVGQSAGSYILPEFAIQGSTALCPLTYTAAFNDKRSWLQWKSDGNTRRIDWYTNDSAQYGTYTITFAATGPGEVNFQVSFFLLVKRPCIDAQFFIKDSFFSSYFKYTIGDSALAIQIPDSIVYTDQSSTECPQDIIFDVTYANGTALIPDLFNWDPLKQILYTQTSDYAKFANNTQHALQFTAHYKDVPAEVKSDSMQFLIDLTIDCNRIPYDIPFVANYTYTIGFSNPYYSVYIPPTYCGNWIYDFSVTTYSKDLSWCTWCTYLNKGLYSFDKGNYIINVNAVGSDKGAYGVKIPVYIPNTNIVQYVTFTIIIQYCQVKDFILTPVANVIQNVFDPQLTIEVPEFVQAPLCGYTLLYQWKSLDPYTGAFTTFPVIFSQNKRLLTYKMSNPLTDQGLYRFQVQGSVSLLYMSPPKAATQEIWIQLVNPCIETVINSDNKLGFSSILSVPLGQSKMVLKYTAPNDKVSLLYGNGQDSCGKRDFQLKDSSGSEVNLQNFSFLKIGQEFEFTISSYPDAGILRTADVILTVSLVDYPNIPHAKFPIKIEYREQYCQVTDFELTPIDNVIHNVFDPQLTIEVPEFKQIPLCGYALNYTWRYLDPNAGAIATLPAIFTQSQRFLTIKTYNALKESGVYQLQVQGAVSLQYMFPQKVATLEVQIEVVNPCIETVINSDNKLGFQSILSVPLGQSKMVLKYTAPNDKVSLLYGNGQDSCGKRDFQLKDSSGSEVNLQNFSFLKIGQEFEFTISSYPDAGILRTANMILTVSLVDYPNIPHAKFPIKIEYREAQNKTESGFEVPFIDPKFSLEPLVIDGFKNVFHTLPEVKNSLNVLSQIQISLPPQVAEFLTYDQPTQTFKIFAKDLQEKHEGIYNIVVQIGFGLGKFEQLKNIPMQIIVKNLKIVSVDPLEPPVPPTNNSTSPFFFEPGKYTPSGIEIPRQKVLKLTKFEMKETLIVNERTGKEPVPTLKSVDPSGMMTIQFDKMMKKPANLDLIKSKEYVVMEEGVTQMETGSRRFLARRREWFNTDEQYLKYLLIIEALEINIIATFDDGQATIVPFTWDLVVFASFDIQIQLYFRQEDMQSQKSQKNTVSITFWGTEFFKDIDDNEVRFGERIETVIRWQVIMLPSEMQNVMNLAGPTNVVIISIVSITLVLFLILQKSLLSLWIMLVSLQLIAHMALMQSMMPGEFVLFLKTILSLIRLPPTGTENDTITALNPIFEMAGYSSTSMSDNLTTTMIVLLPFLVFLAGVLIVLDQLVFRKKRLVLPKVIKTLVSSFITFAAYFFAFCLFEITLCAMIEMKVSESPALAWFSLILSYLPFVYAGTFLYKFQARLNSPPLDEFFEPIQQSKIDETLHAQLDIVKDLNPIIHAVPQLEGSQIESCLVESSSSLVYSSVLESQISQTPIIKEHPKLELEKQNPEEEQHSLQSLPNDAFPPDVYIASEKDFEQAIESLSNEFSLDKNESKQIEIQNEPMPEPMPEPTFSQQGSESEKHIDIDCDNKRECLEGGSSEFAIQAKAKVYYESELKTKSYAILALIFGRKVSKHALIFNLAFAVRAFLCCSALVFGEEWPFPAQILVILVSTTMLICIALDAGKSFWVEEIIKFQYIMNEVAVCFAAIFHFCFSEFVYDFALRQHIGTAFVCLIFGLIILNSGFIIAQAVTATKDKLRIRRLHLEQKHLWKERILMKRQETSTEKRKLSDWLVDPSKNSKNQEEDQLQLTLNRKNKSSKVGPLSDPCSEHYSEYSLHSFRPEDQENQDRPLDYNIPLEKIQIQEQEREEGLLDIYKKFNINIDLMIENFDSHTPSDQDQDDFIHDSDHSKEKEADPGLDQKCLETVLGLCNQERVARDEARYIIPSVMRDAMDIAEQLQILPEDDCPNFNSENIDYDQSRLSLTGLQQACLQERSRLSFFEKLDEVERCLNEEQKEILVSRRETHLKVDLLEIQDSLGLEEDGEVVNKQYGFSPQNDESDSQNDKPAEFGPQIYIEFKKKDNQQSSRVAPKRLPKATKWAKQGYSTQKTATEQPEKPYTSEKNMKKLQPKLDSMNVKQSTQIANKKVTLRDESPEREMSARIRNEQNQVLNTARVQSSIIQHIAKDKIGQRLRNRSQGELIMESYANDNKKKGAIRKSIGDRDSEQGIMSLKLMKAKDPKISQLDLSVFGDSSAGFKYQEEGGVQAFDSHVVDFGKTAGEGFAFYKQGLTSDSSFQKRRAASKTSESIEETKVLRQNNQAILKEVPGASFSPFEPYKTPI